MREHRALGHRTILITGALDFAVAGLKPLFDEIVAAAMTVRRDGTYSGEMSTVPPTGETRAQILADYCAAEGLRLEESIAYADSTSDLPMLEAVGFPVAVNPETRLAALARKRGWLVEHWTQGAGRAPPAAADRPAARRARRAAGSHGRTRHPQADAVESQHDPPTFGGRADERWCSIASSVSSPRPLAGALAPGGGAGRAVKLESSEPPPLPGAGVGAAASPPRRASAAPTWHCRRHRRGLLRSDRQLPVHPRPRGRRRRHRRTAAASSSSPCCTARSAASSRVCASVRDGRINLCERVAFGHVEPGLQTGFCTDTGGGWSDGLVAHARQLVDVPDDLTDEDAVMIEPTACAVHAAARYDGRRGRDHRRRHGRPAHVGRDRRARDRDRSAPLIVAAHYAEQRRLAKELGADIVVHSRRAAAAGSARRRSRWSTATS